MVASSSEQPVVRGLQAQWERLPSPFGIDLLSLVNAGIFIFAVGASVRSAVLSLYLYVEKTFLVSVIILEQDAIYREVLRWMDDFQFRNRDFLSVKAVSSTEETLRHDAGQLESLLGISSRGNQTGNQNFLDIASSLRLEPFQGSRVFRFNGRWILFKHTSPIPNEADSYLGLQRKCHIEIQCLSFSLKPIHNFLETARLHSRKVSVSSTSVLRPIFQGYEVVFWKKITSRPARDLSTVILDKKKKQSLLDDMNEYLRPQTRRWYANHGIPYRRGYLFSGPPGTGKTSLASALAGAFALDIYVMSLQDPDLSESLFQKLLSEAPPRCIVLLEDIDVAGITRKPAPVSNNSSEARTKEKSSAHAAAISLSRLLNAVDGVSSQEGRVLIMTTNSPESIDKALTRPGRVDVHLHFNLPSQQQLHDLFLSIYSDMVSENAAEEVRHGEGSQEEHAVSSHSLDELANRFASKIPVNKFSVAEVQGFLLKYKRNPEAACENIGEWVEQDGNRT